MGLAMIQMASEFGEQEAVAGFLPVSTACVSEGRSWVVRTCPARHERRGNYSATPLAGENGADGAGSGL